MRGNRYAFLPFLYDEAAARLREVNSRFLAEGEPYRAEADGRRRLSPGRPPRRLLRSPPTTKREADMRGWKRCLWRRV